MNGKRLRRDDLRALCAAEDAAECDMHFGAAGNEVIVANASAYNAFTLRFHCGHGFVQLDAVCGGEYPLRMDEAAAAEAVVTLVGELLHETGLERKLADGGLHRFVKALRNEAD